MMNLYLISKHVAVKLRARKGASMVEYAILLAGVAAAAIVAVQLLGPVISGTFGDMTTAMGS